MPTNICRTCRATIVCNRYPIRLPQVIDGDMCDEVRTVYSLSGGESFLISLALALGLSSLSSNNLQVESLFIDEGFGSLDAESLRMAMEALEMLQMQGRKIGVISHVQEMSERISVQIQVHKSVNGRMDSGCWLTRIRLLVIYSALPCCKVRRVISGQAPKRNGSPTKPSPRFT